MNLTLPFTNAQVPVALALAKLGFVFGWRSLQQYQVVIDPELRSSLESYWDLYLLTVLMGLLILLMLARRPRLGAQARQQQQPRPPQQQQQQAQQAP